jgi:hypothetical protein
MPVSSPKRAKPVTDDEKLARHINRLNEANKRPGFGYWWFRDKPFAERSAVRDALPAAGFEMSDLRSIPENQDPPDCEALVDGVPCGIEVTELLHETRPSRSYRLAQRSHE